MKKYNPNYWLDKLIEDEDLSDEGIYAIHVFLEGLCIYFEMKAFHKLRNYRKAQEKRSRDLYEFQNNEDPF